VGSVSVCFWSPPGGEGSGERAAVGQWPVGSGKGGSGQWRWGAVGSEQWAVGCGSKGSGQEGLLPGSSVFKKHGRRPAPPSRAHAPTRSPHRIHDFPRPNRGADRRVMCFPSSIVVR